MMISPEGYYEMNLKDKNKEQIEAEIFELKKEIADLKADIEKDIAIYGKNYPERICPSRSVQIAMNREYLKQAKKALKEIGGKYG